MRFLPPVLALTAAAAIAAGCGSSGTDQVKAFCQNVQTGDSPAAMATQGAAPADPGDPRNDGSHRPLFRNYTVDGRPVTDWQYSDGVILSWSEGYIVAKQC